MKKEHKKNYLKAVQMIPIIKISILLLVPSLLMSMEKQEHTSIFLRKIPAYLGRISIVPTQTHDGLLAWHPNRPFIAHPTENKMAFAISSINNPLTPEIIAPDLSKAMETSQKQMNDIYRNRYNYTFPLLSIQADTDLSSLQWSPDGSQLAVSFGGIPNILALYSANELLEKNTPKKPLQTINLDGFPQSLTWSSDGSHIAVGYYNNAIVELENDTLKVKASSHYNQGLFQTFDAITENSAGKTSIPEKLFASLKPLVKKVLDQGNNYPTNLTHEVTLGLSIKSLAWSPNGKLLAAAFGCSADNKGPRACATLYSTWHISPDKKNITLDTLYNGPAYDSSISRAYNGPWFPQYHPLGNKISWGNKGKLLMLQELHEHLSGFQDKKQQKLTIINSSDLPESAPIINSTTTYNHLNATWLPDGNIALLALDDADSKPMILVKNPHGNQEQIVEKYYLPEPESHIYYDKCLICSPDGTTLGVVSKNKENKTTFLEHTYEEKMILIPRELSPIIQQLNETEITEKSPKRLCILK